MHEKPEKITELLQSMRSGDEEAHSRLIALVYPELKRIAAQQMSRERPNHTLQPTALVNEAFLRLADQTNSWQDRDHFFAAASAAMRRILVDHARRHRSIKRGGRAIRIDFDEGLILDGSQVELVLAVEESLELLHQWDPRQAQIVVFHIYGGLTDEEIARVLNLSARTVKRDWRMAKSYLRSALESRNGRHDSRTLE